MIVVTADSASTSAMPARSTAPTEWARSMASSMCRPWFSSSTADGSAGSPRYPTRASGRRKPVAPPSPRAATRAPRSIRKPVASAWDALLEGHHVVEEAPDPGHHPLTPDRVVGPAGGQVAEYVGAVHRVVQRAPAGVGRIEGVAGVGHRHHQLGTGELGDLGVDAGRLDRERLPRRHQVADRGEELPVAGRVVRRAPQVAVPGVDLLLEVVPDGKQLPVTGGQAADELAEAVPERGRVGAGTGQRLIADEVVERPVDPQTAPLDPLRIAHEPSLRFHGLSARPTGSRARLP